MPHGNEIWRQADISQIILEFTLFTV